MAMPATILHVCSDQEKNRKLQWNDVRKEPTRYEVDESRKR